MLNLPTKRDLFDYVKNHLLTQNVRAENDFGCAYRSHENRCAVGCLIIDKYYREELEGQSLDRSRNVIAAVESSIGRSLTPDEYALVRILQCAHDIVLPQHWKSFLDNLERYVFVADLPINVETTGELFVTLGAGVG